MPTEEIVSAMKAAGGFFLIDDYSSSIPNTRIAEIKDRLESYGVEYSVNVTDHWLDVDILNTDNSGMSEDELECWRDGCNTFLYTLERKKLYACCYAKYAERAGLNAIDSDDYIEIDKTTKMEFLEFIQGYTRKGYVSLCTHCLGIGKNTRQVAPAIQIPRKAAGTKELAEGTGKGPLVSICVPVYNTGKYLVRCVKSLIGQLYSNLEIILVDDGSTDNSGQICNTYAVLDDRVSVIHKPNGGEASARNVGLSVVTGEYVMFIDSDDEYLPDAVLQLVDTVTRGNTDLVIGGYLERRGDVEHFATGHQKRYSTAELARTYLTSKCPYDLPYIATTVNGKLFQMDLIRNNHLSFDERFVIGNDAVFICEYLRYTETICDIFAPIYVYYKYNPTERLQGMGWYYPDTLFLFAYVADRMLKLVKEDSSEFREIIVGQYQNFLYGLMNACINREFFEQGLLPYLENFCKLDLLQTGACLDLNGQGVKREEGALPTQLLSFLIVNEHYQELCDLLYELGRIRGFVPYQGKYIRQMIQLRQEKEPAFSNADSTVDRGHVAGDTVLLGQVDELIQHVVSGQRTAEYFKARAGEAEAKVRDAEARAEEAEARVRDAEVRVGEAEARVRDAEAKVGEAEARVRDAEARTSEAEIRAGEAELACCRIQTEIDLAKAQLDEIVHSTSWRFTEPLRAVMRCLRRG